MSCPCHPSFRTARSRASRCTRPAASCPGKATSLSNSLGPTCGNSRRSDRERSGVTVTSTNSISYDVFVNEPPPQDGFLPNGERKLFSPMASTLIYGNEDAVLTDPGLTMEQARVLGNWVAEKGRNLTDIFVTHGHGDHWF